MVTYVIDLNMMENPAFVKDPTLTALITREPEAHLVVPDTALMEMSKHEDWECTMRLAFAQFTPAAQRTFLSLSVGEILQIEMQTGTAFNRAALLPDDFKGFIQSLIIELAEGRDGTSKVIIRSRFSEVRADLLKNELNTESAKSAIAKLVEPWIKGIQRGVLKGLRIGTYDDRFRRCFIKVNAELLCKQYLTIDGMSEKDVDVFITEKPMMLRYFYLLAGHSLDWAIRGAVHQVRADRELNNQLDQHYALIASYFDDLVTADKQARRAYEDLKGMLAMSTAEAVGYLNAALQSRPVPSA